MNTRRIVNLLVAGRLLLMLCSALFVQPALATSVLQPTSKDAQIFNQNEGPDYHWPNPPWALFGSYVDVKNGYPMIQFDLSALPSTLSSATEVTLELTEQGAFNAHHQYRAHIYAVTEAWDSATVTWNSRDATHAWSTPGGSIDFSKDWASTPFRSAGGEYTQSVYFSMTDLTNAWRSGAMPNHGFVVFPEILIMDNDSPGTPGGASLWNNYTSLALSAADSAFRPRLIFGDVRSPDLILQPMIASIPEPDAWIMIVVGLAAIRLMYWRRSIREYAVSSDSLKNYP